MIKITKIKESENAEFKAADWGAYELGLDNGNISLPVDYTVEGELYCEPEEGGFLSVNRHSRNGVECYGIFRSSRIKSIKKEGKSSIIETNNSIYILEEV